MGAVRTIMLYVAAMALVMVMLPAIIVGWYATSPDSFGTVLHTAVNLMSPAPSAQTGEATPKLAEAAADPAVKVPATDDPAVAQPDVASLAEEESPRPHAQFAAAE